ncbi:hypothetical protein P691DRAFT_768674 [Macrolepiota fuliginosa MF-IS2]|uniref:Uncharacterized protein n=1 Tax=Macrolepiota fuliginosa MF-IS2 TaxID=1400762 RepID=A0A9P5WW94_9AGAR|nr:hypothetical protein P691DRAFT_768674 [Macrolepiota fuliginosa MF-IS2]
MSLQHHLLHQHVLITFFLQFNTLFSSYLHSLIQMAFIYTHHIDLPLPVPPSHQAPDKPNVYDKSTSLVSQFKVPSAKYSAKPKINCSECIAGVKWVEKYRHTSQNKNKDFEAYWHNLMPEECTPFVEEVYQCFLQAVQNLHMLENPK